MPLTTGRPLQTSGLISIIEFTIRTITDFSHSARSYEAASRKGAELPKKNRMDLDGERRNLKSQIATSSLELGDEASGESAFGRNRWGACLRSSASFASSTLCAKIFWMDPSLKRPCAGKFISYKLVIDLSIITVYLALWLITPQSHP